MMLVGNQPIRTGERASLARMLGCHSISVQEEGVAKRITCQFKAETKRGVSQRKLWFDRQALRSLIETFRSATKAST